MSAEPRQKLEFAEKLVVIHIRNQKPEPAGEVVVAAREGRVEFRNDDDRDYGIAVWRKHTHRNLAIDLLLPARQTMAFTSAVDEEVHYEVLDRIGQVATGHGGGPIKFVVLSVLIGRGGGPVK